MVKDGSGSVLLSKTCGSGIPAAIASLSTTVEIIFHTDYSVTSKVFNIEWRTTKGKLLIILHLSTGLSVNGVSEDQIPKSTGGTA